MSELNELLRFEPIFRRYLWGGRRLGTVLGKPIGPGEDYAESWELVDHGDDQSVVAFGELKGRTLATLAAELGAELLGRHHPVARFPLLFKFLDCQRDLSVQVHPNDQQASRLVPPDLGKTEAWIILDAQPGSRLFAGLKRGFDRAAFERELHRGTAHLCLHQVAPQPGDCLFIPAGTIHALGAGMLVAEIQQASDTTYRLYDWNRVGADGKRRPLQIEQGLAVTDFTRGPVEPQLPEATGDPDVCRLASCDKFIVDRVVARGRRALGGDLRFHLIAVTKGAVEVEGDPSQQPLTFGQTALLPAAAGKREIRSVDGVSEFLEIYLP